MRHYLLARKIIVRFLFRRRVFHFVLAAVIITSVMICNSDAPGRRFIISSSCTKNAIS